MLEQTSLPLPIREEVHRLADQLPDGATWDDVMYQIFVRHKLAVADAAIDAGDVVDHQEAKRWLLGR